MRGLLLLFAIFFCSTVHAQEAFTEWLGKFEREALEQGISQPVLDAALPTREPLQKVVELDRRQPEFVQTFADYLQKRITQKKVTKGRDLLAAHAGLFDVIEDRYGLPGPILVALWGMETNYGSNKGSIPIPAALATLAYDNRRSTFFRGQLLDSLHIIEAGHVEADAMTGSWAGAFGHMQFMPSTYLAYAMDGDEDGRIDVWNSLADAMHSAANYLRQAGWQAGQPVAIAVALPEQFDWQAARLDNRQAVDYWAEQGVVAANGQALPPAGSDAAIVLPQGWRGQAFMVFDNFDVLMQWNRSANYALTTSHLAYLLDGGEESASQAGAPPVLSREQMLRLQQALAADGFAIGAADGIPGPRTESAIRDYQIIHRLPADGYPSPELLEHIEQTLATGRTALSP